MLYNVKLTLDNGKQTSDNEKDTLDNEKFTLDYGKQIYENLGFMLKNRYLTKAIDNEKLNTNIGQWKINIDLWTTIIRP